MPKKVQSSNCAASANCSFWFSAQPWGVGVPEARGSSHVPFWPCGHCPPAPWQATAPNGPWGSPHVPWHSAQQWSHAPWLSGPPAPWGIAPAPWGVAPASTTWIMPPMPAPQPPPSSIPKPESSVFSSKTNPGREKVRRKQWSEELRCVEVVKKRIRQREEDLLRAIKGNVNFKWPLPLPCYA